MTPGRFNHRAGQDGRRLAFGVALRSVTHMIDATAHVPACGVSTVPSSACGEPAQGRSFCARNQEPVLHLLFAEFVHAIRVRVAGDALLGASGITLEYAVLRHASNLESVLAYEGTEEVHQLAVGKSVTDYSALRPCDDA